MRRIFFALVVAGATQTMLAFAGEPIVWHFGESPFAHSLTEACKKMPIAIDGFSFPKEVKEHFKSLLRDKCEDGEEVFLTPGTMFEQMWSGRRGSHLMEKNGVQRVVVGRYTVPASSKGTKYPADSIFEVPNASAWTYEYEGQTYILYLPFVCFNWSWAYGDPPLPAPAEPKCYEVAFNAPVEGTVRWGVATVSGPLPSDGCNAQKEGNDGQWLAWHGQCDICDPAMDHIRNAMGDNVAVPHRYLYPIANQQQVLRFSNAVKRSLVYFCLQDKDGRESCGVYVRPEDWGEKTRIAIPDSMWVWDGSCQKENPL